MILGADNGRLVMCAHEGCPTTLVGEPPNTWAFTPGPNGRIERLCPEHSVGADIVPSPFRLTESEEGALGSAGLDPSQHVAVTVHGELMVGVGPHGFFVQVGAAFPPVLKALRKSLMVGPDGRPIIERLPIAMPAQIRLVLPRTALTDETQAEEAALLVSPRRYMKPRPPEV